MKSSKTTYHVVTCNNDWYDPNALNWLRVLSNHRKLSGACRRNNQEQVRCYRDTRMHLDQRVVAKQGDDFRWLNADEIEESQG